MTVLCILYTNFFSPPQTACIDLETVRFLRPIYLHLYLYTFIDMLYILNFEIVCGSMER